MEYENSESLDYVDFNSKSTSPSISHPMFRHCVIFQACKASFQCPTVSVNVIQELGIFRLNPFHLPIDLPQLPLDLSSDTVCSVQALKSKVWVARGVYKWNTRARKLSTLSISSPYRHPPSISRTYVPTMCVLSNSEEQVMSGPRCL